MLLDSGGGFNSEPSWVYEYGVHMASPQKKEADKLLHSWIYQISMSIQFLMAGDLAFAANLVAEFRRLLHSS